MYFTFWLRGSVMLSEIQEESSVEGIRAMSCNVALHNERTDTVGHLLRL